MKYICNRNNVVVIPMNQKMNRKLWKQSIYFQEMQKLHLNQNFNVF
jgi:hypothetical protein